MNKIAALKQMVNLIHEKSTINENIISKILG